HTRCLSDWSSDVCSSDLKACGRIGYMLFYTSPAWMLHDPLQLFRVWEGGMSFHGGLLGVLAAVWWWSRRNGIHFFDTTDFVAPRSEERRVGKEGRAGVGV